MTAAERIEPGTDIIDSRDIIERIDELEILEQDIKDAKEELAEIDAEDPEVWGDCYDEDRQTRRDALAEAEADFTAEEREELETLRELQDEASSAADWQYGETLIHEDYFTDYIKELVDDCYEMPKGFESGAWPWRHMAMDWEAAAEEAKQDYFTAEYDGHTYYIR